MMSLKRIDEACDQQRMRRGSDPNSLASPAAHAHSSECKGHDLCARACVCVSVCVSVSVCVCVCMCVRACVTPHPPPFPFLRPSVSLFLLP